jgi:hypothetical protein
MRDCPQFTFDLSIKRDIEGKENFEDCMEKLHACVNPEERDGNDIWFDRIVDRAENLLIYIYDRDKNGTANAIPVTIPLECKLARDLIAQPDSEKSKKRRAERRSANNKLLRDVACSGTDDKGYCAAYINDEEGAIFPEFKGIEKKQLDNNDIVW